MKVISTIEHGVTETSEPFLRVGENVFEYKSLSLANREFVDAMIEAKVVTVVEQDEPAEVVQMPPVAAGGATKKRSRHAAADVIPFPEPTPAAELEPVAKQRRVRTRARA